MGGLSSTHAAAAGRERCGRLERAEALRRRLADVEADEAGQWQRVYGCKGASQLAQLLRSGGATAVQALHAYQHRALAAHDATNCAADFLPEAEAAARRLDAEYDGVPADRRPPLFGVPFSVKEHLELAGHVSTYGYAHRLEGPPAERDALPVEMLRRAGAVPFVRTNVPIGMISYNCSNPTYGLTTHPLDKDRTPGGSTGGEGALLSMGGAPFGLGTDGGGSIRLPSAFCGLAGVKPTSARVSQCGVPANLPGVVVLGITWGPMAADVDSLAAGLMVALSTAAMTVDPYYLCVPFNDQVYQSAERLRIGYYEHDGWFECTPAARRAVAMAKDALEAEGHELVRWELPDVEHAIRLFFALFMPADGAGVKRLFLAEGNFYEPHMSETLLVMRLPAWLKRAVGYVLHWSGFPSFKRIAAVLMSISSSGDSLRLAYEETLVYRKRMVDSWRRHGLDAVLSPAFVGAAPRHMMPDKCALAAAYSAVWNLVDFAAGTVPVTRVTKGDEEQMSGYPSSDMWYRLAKEDQSRGTVGLPIGVQCVAPPNHEELCLRLMKTIQDKLPLGAR